MTMQLMLSSACSLSFVVASAVSILPKVFNIGIKSKSFRL